MREAHQASSAVSSNVSEAFDLSLSLASLADVKQLGQLVPLSSGADNSSPFAILLCALFSIEYEASKTLNRIAFLDTPCCSWLEKVRRTKITGNYVSFAALSSTNVASQHFPSHTDKAVDLLQSHALLTRLRRLQEGVRYSTWAKLRMVYRNAPEEWLMAMLGLSEENGKAWLDGRAELGEATKMSNEKWQLCKPRTLV